MDRPRNRAEAHRHTDLNKRRARSVPFIDSLDRSDDCNSVMLVDEKAQASLKEHKCQAQAATSPSVGGSGDSRAPYIV
jgi:hypothetical protein